MGAKHSTAAPNLTEARTYEKNGHVSKNGKQRGQRKKKAAAGRQLNNNYEPDQRRGDYKYHVSYCSDDELTVHKEMTKLVLEAKDSMVDGAALHDSLAISPLQMDVTCETDSRLHFRVRFPLSLLTYNI